MNTGPKECIACGTEYVQGRWDTPSDLCAACRANPRIAGDGKEDRLEPLRDHLNPEDLRDAGPTSDNNPHWDAFDT